MNYANLEKEFNWLLFDGQMDCDVTYVFVGRNQVPRLLGSSDILYIGRTEQPIKVRFEQETHTNNSPKNTQQTNIRMTHVLGQLGADNYRCYYVRELNIGLSGKEKDVFLSKVRTWDKKFFLNLTTAHVGGPLELPFEKYLLVNYADQHLELPPLNNRL